jgi:hypothetical protein
MARASAMSSSASSRTSRTRSLRSSRISTIAAFNASFSLPSSINVDAMDASPGFADDLPMYHMPSWP